MAIVAILGRRLMLASACQSSTGRNFISIYNGASPGKGVMTCSLSRPVFARIYQADLPWLSEGFRSIVLVLNGGGGGQVGRLSSADSIR